MARQVVGLFDSMGDVQAAIDDLERIGIDRAEISMVANNSRGDGGTTVSAAGTSADNHGTDAGEGASVGATSGAIVGGLTGVLIGLGALTLPGIGPVLAAGPFAAAIGTSAAALGAGAIGAGVGAVTGGLLGALVGAGIPEQDARVYAEGIRRGGALLMVRAEPAEVDAIIDVMERHNVVDLDARGQVYRSSGDDEEAGIAAERGEPLTREPRGSEVSGPGGKRRARAYDAT